MPNRIDPHRALVASTALSMDGMNTRHLPGTGAGIDACAAAVQLVLRSVFGHPFVGGGGNPIWVPDLRAGLLAGGWRAFDDATGALAGDVGIQNGTHDGTADNPYENHVGIVVMDPEGSGELKILSNSSSRGAFIYVDDLEFSHIGYPPGKMGPTRFYRYKPS
ncbi:MAG TPA: hypothetical protein VGC96_01320 [Candidatus Elarobacter sp.]|jgi:hypothetical protein